MLSIYMNLKTRHRIVFVFLLCFLFSIVFSYSYSHAHPHPHAPNTFTENEGHEVKHYLPFTEGKCCELHGEDRVVRHNIKSVAPLTWLTLPKIAHFIQAPLSCQSFPYSIDNAFRQKFFTSFSGLSPPQG